MKQKEISRRWYQKLKTDPVRYGLFIEKNTKRGVETKRKRRTEYMRDKACSFCGRNDRLHLHHTDPATKTAHTSHIWGWRESRRLAEIAKCIILCTNCHAQLHGDIKRKNTPIVHGGLRTYKHKGCRCWLCRGVNRLHLRYYEKHKKCLPTHISEYVFNLSNLMVANGHS
ncbi:hypothetical protein LCGC14_2323100 [marine sediment metagenome]|uniref:Uncharacterized protein n=1 Tax=marine sediment metagenome TaxID=412755 RepID=A0A0F9CH83_9ZZZZ